MLNLKITESIPGEKYILKTNPKIGYSIGIILCLGVTIFIINLGIQDLSKGGDLSKVAGDYGIALLGLLFFGVMFSINVISDIQQVVFDKGRGIFVRNAFKNWEIPWKSVLKGCSPGYSKYNGKEGVVFHTLSVNIKVSLPDNLDKNISGGNALVISAISDSWDTEEVALWNRIDDILFQLGLKEQVDMSKTGEYEEPLFSVSEDTLPADVKGLFQSLQNVEDIPKNVVFISEDKTGDVGLAVVMFIIFGLVSLLATGAFIKGTVELLIEGNGTDYMFNLVGHIIFSVVFALVFIFLLLYIVRKLGESKAVKNGLWFYGIFLTPDYFVIRTKEGADCIARSIILSAGIFTESGRYRRSCPSVQYLTEKGTEDGVFFEGSWKKNASDIAGIINKWIKQRKG